MTYYPNGYKDRQDSDQKYLILRVYDSVEDGYSFGDHIRKLGFDYVSTNVGRKDLNKYAVQTYRDNKPTLVIIDVNTPLCFEFVNRIKRSDPNSKIIIVTADITIQNDNRLFKGKVDGLVYKPYLNDELEVEINRIVKSKNVKVIAK